MGGAALQRRSLLALAGAALLLCLAGHASAAPLIPTVSLDVGTSENPQDVAASMQLLAVLTVLSLAPAMLIMTTSFVRIVVVIGFLRNALSTQNVPPNQVALPHVLYHGALLGTGERERHPALSRRADHAGTST